SFRIKPAPALSAPFPPPPTLRERPSRPRASPRSRASAAVFVLLAYRRPSSLEMLAKVAKRRIRDHLVERMCTGTGQPVLVRALVIRVVRLHLRIGQQYDVVALISRSAKQGDLWRQERVGSFGENQIGCDVRLLQRVGHRFEVFDIVAVDLAASRFGFADAAANLAVMMMHRGEVDLAWRYPGQLHVDGRQPQQAPVVENAPQRQQGE